MIRWKAHRGKIASLSFSRDGKTLATVTGSGRDIFIWDATTGTQFRKLTVEDVEGKLDYQAASNLCFAPGADFLAVARKHWVEVWDASSWVRVAEARYWAHMPGEVEFAPGPHPRLAASTSNDTTVYEIPKPTTDVASLVEVAKWQPNYHTQLSFTNDGNAVATHTVHEVEVRECSSGKLLRQLEHKRANYCGPVRFDPDAGRIAFCSTKVIESWPASLDDTCAVIRYVGHKDKVWALRYTPDGQTLISASSDGTVRVWEAATGAEQRCFELDIGKIVATDVSPAGTIAAVGGANGEVVVWDLD
jgi:WD40 repeat protein